MNKFKIKIISLAIVFLRTVFRYGLEAVELFAKNVDCIMMGMGSLDDF